MTAVAEAKQVRIELHPRQSSAFASTATELLYGGAAGGGKSFYLRVSAIRWCLAAPGVQVYLFRRSFPDLRANHLRGAQSLPDLLGPLIEAGQVKWNEQAQEFRFAGGSVLKLAHLSGDGDLAKYQGAEIHVLLMDELTHFTEHQYRFLRARVRLGSLAVPEHLRGCLPRIECASNPGSIGHAWVKAAWVSAAPPETVWQADAADGGMRRAYLPAKLADNPTMTVNDPAYADRLAGLGSEAMVRAWLDGDWDIVAGQAFEKFRRDKHVVAPFTIPAHWLRLVSMDWGSSKPFSVGWWAVADGTTPGIPAGALVRYREWYGWNGQPDVGVRMEVEEVARGILEREAVGEKIAYRIADLSIFSQDGGPSHAERFAKAGVVFKGRDWFRGNPKDRRLGYQEVRGRLAGVDGVPMLFTFSTCTDGFLRTIPDLVLDEHNPEDVDTTQEDHAYDETRYACMSRPFVLAAKTAPKKIDRWDRAMRGDDNVQGWRVA